MAAIKSSHTKPERIIRQGLHALGFRCRLHVKGLPGKPDLAFPRYRAVVFVNGCFWHQHDCHLFRWPATRTQFWQEKISRNAENDQRIIAQLRSTGWRVAIIWECALKGKTRLTEAETMQQLAEWLKSPDETITIRGR